MIFNESQSKIKRNRFFWRGGGGGGRRREGELVYVIFLTKKPNLKKKDFFWGGGGRVGEGFGLGEGGLEGGLNLK